MIVSLTTIPGREPYLQSVLQSIVPQLKEGDRIVLNVCEEYKRFPKETLKLPDTIKDYDKNILVVNKAEDYGPLTKLVPTLKKWPNEQILTVDDDCLLHPDTLDCYRRYLRLGKSCALALRGRKLNDLNYHNARLVVCNEIASIENVDIITGVWSAMYNSSLFDMDFFENLDDQDFMNDDITICGHLHEKEIETLIIPANIIQSPTPAHAINDLWSSNAKSGNNNKLIRKYWK